MVRSKKLGSQTKSKEEPVRHEKNPSSYQQQDSRSKGGGDTKKKVICTKISDLASEQLQFNQPTMQKRSSATSVSDQLPNYMKSTCSSDARNEKFKVANHSPTTSDRIRSSRNLSNLNYSKPSTSFPDGSGLKYVKILKRKPTLKQVRPLMKKNSLGVALCPKLYVNRATCSSTLKVSKSPKALEVNPGGTEAEGTSVMKVCPYTYCCLNGHRHETLPPLKCFLSLRRNLLKTQKSMKVMSPFRKKGVGKDEKEVETGQAALSRAPSALRILMEEVANDFFVDIYAQPHKQIVKSVNCEERSLTGSTEDPEEDRIITTATALTNQAPTEASGKQKAKISIVRKRRTDEEDQMKEFIPQAPNFLPIEPDPEAEKVYLRHQEMDERKNAEEWMIDYALQQAVTKPAPAQKRKVALLVEAFETVMQMPMCEKTEQHTSQGFDHARPIQACS